MTSEPAGAWQCSSCFLPPSTFLVIGGSARLLPRFVAMLRQARSGGVLLLSGGSIGPEGNLVSFVIFVIAFARFHKMYPVN